MMDNSGSRDRKPYESREIKISDSRIMKLEILKAVQEFLAKNDPISIVVVMTEVAENGMNRSHAKTMVHPSQVTGVKNSLLDVIDAF